MNRPCTARWLNTRSNVGLLDASTLGKIIVKGPDAGRFLDMLYTNVMSTLPVGKCRYGLMCNEQGFLSDDGVVVRLSEDTWLCHTTSGGADRIHGWMEDWLQCEWWDWKVYTANVTEQYAQIAVVGPKARKVLESWAGWMSRKRRCPSWPWSDGTLGGFPVRIYRISFSGELSPMKSPCPANLGRAFWDALRRRRGRVWHDALWHRGAACPAGRKGLHHDRRRNRRHGDPAGPEPRLGDFQEEGRLSGQARAGADHLASPDRWKLVGFETLDGSVLPRVPIAIDGVNANGQRNTQGRITSTYHSPTLGKGIAMGLLRHGPARIGEVVEFTTLSGEGTVKARVVSPVFFDPEGERNNA
jgi:sarcosine oxidase subunit alpha